jgi:hypothetical protein
MAWRTRFALFAAAVVGFLSFPAHSQLYVATGSGGVTGNLYTVDPATAVATVVGPILAGGLPIAMTGLAFDPTTNLLYGITSNNSPNIPRHLVTINPATALATDIGALGIGGADIAFDAAGNLYMTSGNATNLYSVNKATGAATVIGATGTGDSGSGLAINAGGTAFFAGNGDHGALATLNLATGAATLGATLTGAPNNGGIDSMKFSSTGVLFGVDNNNSPVNNLVTINTATGAVTNIGALPPSIDGMAFGAGGLGSSAVPTLGEWALIAMALLLGGTGFVALRRRTA